MMTFSEIKEGLLNEARLSPNLLHDLAGLETYVSESYQSRSLMELIQNADDARSTQFIFEVNDRHIICANNGRSLDSNDILSLCRSAASKKNRGETIGYRGIGFKSVVAFCSRVSILSGEYELTFSREITKSEINTINKVPLIRIPHQLSLIDTNILLSISRLKDSGYTTFFVFEEIINEDVKQEIINLPISSLLFLNYINSVNLTLDQSSRAVLTTRKNSGDSKEVTISESESALSWLITEKNYVSIAAPINMAPTAGLVHVFLPTEDETGFACIFNGDFSTDPARRHVIFDDKSNVCLRETAQLYVSTLLSAIYQRNNQMIDSLMPTVDANIAFLQNKGFIGKFLLACQNYLKSTPNDYQYIPAWFKPDPIETAKIKVYGKKTLNLNGVEKLRSFLRFIGVKELSLSDLLNVVSVSGASYYSFVQISAKCIKNLVSPDPIKILKGDERIFVTEQGNCSLKELKETMTLKDSFIEDLLAEGLTEYEINDFNERILGKQKRQIIFSQSKPPIVTVKNEEPSAKFFPTKRWRATELLVMEALNSQGYSLTDVSKSNLGYDLDGTAPSGRRIYIEVKSITVPKEKFRMTNNEVALSRELGEDYVIAIAMTSDCFINIHLTSSPLESMKVNRQCTQWIWEVEEYEFSPKRFDFS